MSGGFQLEKRLSERGLHLLQGAKERVALYLDLLVQWNRKTNLVGPRDAETIFETLIVDSLRLGPFLDTLGLSEAPRCLDLGAGAGLPGIPLRCCWERGEYHLVEVREKRCVFMRLAVGRLGLQRTYVLQSRAEEALTQIAKSEGVAEIKADLILSRAFMPWAELLPFVQPMLSPGGRVVVLANTPVPEALPTSWKTLGCTSYRVRTDEGETERWFWGLEWAERSTVDAVE